MSAVEHQFLNYRNVLSYTINIDDSNLFDYVSGIHNSINTLNYEINGKIVLTQKNGQTEFIIPVNRDFPSTQSYKYKKEFKLVNAVRIRHYGSYRTIAETVDELKTYIHQHSLTPITQPYFVVQDRKVEIYDVLIGVSENIL